MMSIETIKEKVAYWKLPEGHRKFRDSVQREGYDQHAVDLICSAYESEIKELKKQIEELTNQS